MATSNLPSSPEGAASLDDTSEEETTTSLGSGFRSERHDHEIRHQFYTRQAASDHRGTVSTTDASSSASRSSTSSSTDPSASAMAMKLQSRETDHDKLLRWVLLRQVVGHVILLTSYTINSLINPLQYKIINTIKIWGPSSYSWITSKALRITHEKYKFKISQRKIDFE